MRRFLFIALIVGLFFSVTGNITLAKTKNKISTKQKIEFTTKDKFILVGDLYLAQPKTDKPLVVLLHSYGLSARYWGELPEKLRLKGYNVLAMDLRGHARSVYTDKLKLKSRYNFSKENWQKLPNDVVQSVSYIKSNYPYINCNDIYMVGADIGASAAVLSGLNLKNKPDKIVLISPMLNFKGLYIPIKIAHYKHTKFLVLLSKSDKILFNFHTDTKPEIKTYPTGGQGNLLLKANKESDNDIINFLTK